MSDQVGNQNVVFLMMLLIYYSFQYQLDVDFHQDIQFVLMFLRYIRPLAYVADMLVTNRATAPIEIDIVIVISFRTGKSGQTLQTQIRLLLEEQSDRGLHCLLFHFMHLFEKIPKGLASLFEF